jgi:bacterioferritin
MTEKNTINKLNELLKGEHMAIHIYERTKELQKDSQVANMLSEFASDHKLHAQQLTKRIIELGGKPEETIGLPGMMADLTSVINSIRGPQQLLEQVYDGEDKGVHAYEERLDQIDPTSQEMIRQIMKEDHEHLKWFKTRMEKEKSEKH